MDKNLIYNFLKKFSRIEYALKATIDFANGNENGVNPNWDEFANNIHKTFMASKDKDLEKAINYIWEEPPKKQVLKNEKLEFVNRKIDKKQKKTQQILLMVRGVRNNLFHGGKYHEHKDYQPDRNKLLIEHSIKILSECVKMNKDVYNFYRKT